MRYEVENYIAIRALDENLVEHLIEQDIEIGFVCAGCRKRNCVKTEVIDGVEHEFIKCDHVVVVDRKYYRPLCAECYVSYQTPRSTAAKLLGL